MYWKLDATHFSFFTEWKKNKKLRFLIKIDLRTTLDQVHGPEYMTTEMLVVINRQIDSFEVIEGGTDPLIQYFSYREIYTFPIGQAFDWLLARVRDTLKYIQ